MPDNVMDIRKPDLICIDCGKLFMAANAGTVTVLEETATLCPRCSSTNNMEYVEADHQHIEIKVPENYQHSAEEHARVLFDRVSKMTGWRESKVRLWFQLQNPLLGEVSPEWMLMNERGDRLERFIAEAEELNKEYRGNESEQDAKQT